MSRFAGGTELMIVCVQEKYGEVFEKYKAAYEAQKTNQLTVDLDAYAKFEDRLHERYICDGN